MSQFERPGPPDSVLRNHPVALPQTGTTESLSAPGVVPIPYHQDRGAQIADQFLKSVGHVGQLASDVATEQRRAAAEQRRADELAKDAYHGQAAIDSQTALPGIVDQIEQRKLIAPDGVTADQFATEYVSQKTEGMPEEYRKAYARTAAPAIARAVVAQQQAARVQAQNEDLALRAQANAVEVDPSAILARVDAAQKLYPDLGPTELKSKLIVPAMLSAAKAGNADVLTATSEALGGPKDFAPEKQQAQAFYVEAKAREKALANSNAIDQFGVLQEQGATPSELRDFVKSHKEIDPNTRVALEGHIASAERKQLEDTQKANTNALAAHIHLGLWPTDQSGNPDPVSTVREIGDRMLLPDTDPRHVPADTGNTLIKAVEKAVNTDVRSAIVENAMGARGPVPVLTPDDSNAMLAALNRRGIVTGQPKSEGQFILTGIADPLAFASQASRFNMVPDKAEAWIRQGATSQDPAQATPALATYAAIYAQDPTLAASIQLPPEAAARARYVVSRLENGNPVWKNGNPVWKTDNAVLAATVSKLATTAIKIDPVIAALDQKQVLGTVLFKDPQTATVQGPNFDNQVASQITKDLKSRLGDQVGTSPKIIPAQLFDDYKRNLVDEFKIQRSLTTDDAQAAENAKKWAMQRTIADNPPSTWGGVTRFQSKGQPVIDAPVADALRGEIKKSIDSDTASTLWTRYVPVYTKQTASGRPGFMFMPTDGSGAPFTAAGGRTLVVSLPDSNDEASAAAKQVAAKEHARQLIRGETSKILQNMEQMRRGDSILRMGDRPSGWNQTEEAKFQAWYAPIAAANNLDANPDNPNHHYNYRAAFRAGVEPGADGHWPSRFKDASHPNRFVSGVDTITGRPRFPTFSD